MTDTDVLQSEVDRRTEFLSQLNQAKTDKSEVDKRAEDIAKKIFLSNASSADAVPKPQLGEMERIALATESTAKTLREIRNAFVFLIILSALAFILSML